MKNLILILCASLLIACTGPAKPVDVCIYEYIVHWDSGPKTYKGSYIGYGCPFTVVDSDLGNHKRIIHAEGKWGYQEVMSLPIQIPVEFVKCTKTKIPANIKQQNEK